MAIPRPHDHLEEVRLASTEQQLQFMPQLLAIDAIKCTYIWQLCTCTSRHTTPVLILSLAVWKSQGKACF
jgi:hypothetical protein